MEQYCGKVRKYCEQDDSNGAVLLNRPQDVWEGYHKLSSIVKNSSVKKQYFGKDHDKCGSIVESAAT
jgi:hypothetical protein